MQDEREIERARRELKKTDVEYAECIQNFENLRSSTSEIFQKKNKTWTNFCNNYYELKRKL